MNTLASPANPPTDRAPQALAVTIAAHCARLAELNNLVTESRDIVAIADAALATFILERDRTVWALEQLAELNADTDPQ